jgi:hypothetical protein
MSRNPLILMAVLGLNIIVKVLYSLFFVTDKYSPYTHTYTQNVYFLKLS